MTTLCTWGLLAAALGAAQPAVEQPGILVPRAVGVAALEGPREAVRERALADAMRNAVEAGLGVMVRSETKVEDYQLVKDRIELQDLPGFVFDQRVIEEGPRDELYQVVLSCRVGTLELVDKLAGELPQVYELLERPRLMLLLAEQKTDGTPSQAVTTGLAKALTDRGLDVVERAQIDALGERDKVQQAAQGNAEAAAWLAAQLNAEILVCGNATVGPEQTDAQVRVVNAWDARIIAAATARGATPEAAVRGLLPGPAVKDDLVNQMLARWLAQPTLLTVLLARAPYGTVRSLVGDLQGYAAPRVIDLTDPVASSRVPILGEATLRNFNPRVSTLELRTPLRRLAALDALTATFGRLGYEITGVNGLRIDLAPKMQQP